jgi:hypothetical protein
MLAVLRCSTGVPELSGRSLVPMALRHGDQLSRCTRVGLDPGPGPPRLTECHHDGAYLVDSPITPPSTGPGTLCTGTQALGTKWQHRVQCRLGGSSESPRALPLGAPPGNPTQLEVEVDGAGNLRVGVTSLPGGDMPPHDAGPDIRAPCLQGGPERHPSI